MGFGKCISFYVTINCILSLAFILLQNASSLLVALLPSSVLVVLLFHRSIGFKYAATARCMESVCSYIVHMHSVYSTCLSSGCVIFMMRICLRYSHFLLMYTFGYRLAQFGQRSQLQLYITQIILTQILSHYKHVLHTFLFACFLFFAKKDKMTKILKHFFIPFILLPYLRCSSYDLFSCRSHFLQLENHSQ